MPRLFAYFMTDDKGVAPNPDGGVLTLGLCKKDIIAIARPGDIIVGITGSQLQCCTGLVDKSICYVAKISEKLTLQEYDEQYFNVPGKTPEFDTHGCKIKDKQKGTIQFGKDKLNSSTNITGDNIYDRKKSILRDYAHSIEGLDGEVEKDLKVPYVLCAKEFYYFGSKAAPPEDLTAKLPMYQDILNTIKIATILDKDGKKIAKYSKDGKPIEVRTGAYGLATQDLDADKFWNQVTMYTNTYFPGQKGKIGNPSEDFKKYLLEGNLEDALSKAKLNVLLQEANIQKTQDTFDKQMERNKRRRDVEQLPIQGPLTLQAKVDPVESAQTLVSGAPKPSTKGTKEPKSYNQLKQGFPEHLGVEGGAKKNI